MSTYTWTVPTDNIISGLTYIKDTDNKIQATIDDLADFVNGEGSYTGQGLTYDFVNKITSETITGIKTFSNGIVADVTGNVTGNVTGDVTGNADSATTLSTGDDRTKLDGIEAEATADQTGAEIKALYEAEADTNGYTDAEKDKLAGIDDGANNYSLPTATQTTLGGVRAYVSGTTLYINF